MKEELSRKVIAYEHYELKKDIEEEEWIKSRNKEVKSSKQDSKKVSRFITNELTPNRLN